MLSSVITLNIPDIELARSNLVAAANAADLTLGAVRDDHIEVLRGSQAKLRFFGGAFVPLRFFPVLGIVQFIPGFMRVTVQSNLGFGSMLGMKKKYQKACDQFAQELAAMSQTGAAPAVPFTPTPPFLPSTPAPPTATVPPFVPSSPAPAAAAATKLCPFCAEVIQEAAIKCKHCGEMLDT